MGVFSTPRRIVAAWFPWWPVERLAWRFPEARTRPFATIGEQRGRLVIEAVNPRAAGAGLAPGMPLADGRAIVPDVVAHPTDPVADAHALKRLARWADGFTPGSCRPARTGSSWMSGGARISMAARRR